MKILLLVDYRHCFYSSRLYPDIGMDIKRIQENFQKGGFYCEIKSFTEVINNECEYKGWLVLYQSSEDRGLYYKDFIEDVLLGMERMGAILIPEFMLFRAHHNKVFFEIIKKSSNIDSLTSLKSRVFGTYEELAKADYKAWRYPKVVKSSEGSGSKSVFLVKTPKELLKTARGISRSFHMADAIRFFGKSIIRRGYINESLNRKKFIVQEFIPDLTHDYKVLVYGHRYYVLKRNVRKNDFRASGSGDFSFPSIPPESILDAARSILSYYNVPFLSADIAETPDKVVAIELQFIRFGTYTQRAANWYFVYEDEHWKRVDEKPNIEDVFTEAIIGNISGKNYI